MANNIDFKVKNGILVNGGNISIASATGLVGYALGTQTATVSGANTSLFGMSIGTNTGFSGPGVQLHGYYGVILGTNGAERVRVAATGYVGVGTATPLTTLHIQSGNVNPLIVTRASDVTVNGASGTTIDIGALNGSTPTTAGQLGAVLLNPATSGYLYFNTLTSGALTEKMRIDSSGNVGIGATAPAALLDVSGGTGIVTRSTGTAQIRILGGTGTLGSTEFAIQQDASAAYVWQRSNAPILFGTNGAERVRIDGSGNLGIGTTGPVQKLEVQSTTGGYTMALTQSAGYASGLLGGVAFRSNYNSSGSQTDVASIRGGKENSANGDYAGMLSFYTRPNGGVDTERIRITSSGVVQPGADNTQTLGAPTTRWSTLYAIGISDGAAAAGALIGSTSTTVQHGAGTGWVAQAFYTGGTERMRINSGGDVGIGTNAPGYKLDVSSTSQNNPVVRIIKANSGTANEHGGALIIANQGPANIARASGTYGGRIEFQYSQPTSQAMQVGASIYSAADGTQSGTGTAAFLGFCTSDATAGGANNERMRITASGDVGIGGYPSRKFCVQGDAGIGVLPTAGDGITTLSTASTGITVLDCYHGTLPGQFVVRTNNTGGVGTSEKFRIDGTGAVTISRGGASGDILSMSGLNTTEGFTHYFGTDTSDNPNIGYYATNWNTGTAQLHFRMGGRTSGQTKMVLDEAGNLMLGVTTSQGGRMDLDSSTNVILMNLNSTAANGGYIRFQRSGTAIGDLGSGANVVSGGGASDFGINVRTTGNLLFGTNATEKMRLDASGNLLLGATSGIAQTFRMLVAANSQTAAVPLGLNDTRTDGSSAIILSFNRQGTQNGSVTCTPTATSYITSSDARLKKNIVDAPSAVEKVKAMQVRSFDWKVDGSHVEHGFIAQELNTVEPLAVAEGDTWGVDPSKLVATLTKALQEALARIEALEAKLA
jgi:hypothetical protein